LKKARLGVAVLVFLPGAGWVPVEPADAHPGRFGCTRGGRLGFSAEPAAAGAAADLLALRW
jgi:transglutaminase-like putative cysteine protease